MRFRLLDAFEAVFAGRRYRHRANTQGDQVGLELYEDLYQLDRSPKYRAAVDQRYRGLNLRNVREGIRSRRGDGTFGELIPGQSVIRVPGYAVARGPVATLDIGIEVKILNKAMIKQINDRISGLQKQAEYFVRGRDGRSRGNPIAVALIAINHAEFTVGYEGDRAYRTDGMTHAHPANEAPEVERRLIAEVAPHYDETIVLRYKATNEAPYPFDWVDRIKSEAGYAAALVRIAGEWERRF